MTRHSEWTEEKEKTTGGGGKRRGKTTVGSSHLRRWTGESANDFRWIWGGKGRHSVMQSAREGTLTESAQKNPLKRERSKRIADSVCRGERKLAGELQVKSFFRMRYLKAGIQEKGKGETL